MVPTDEQMQQPRRGGGISLAAWVDEVAAQLGVRVDVDIAELLELAGEVEREMERPAAPLTTFLVGYAAARGGNGRAVVHELTGKIRAILTTMP